MTAYPRHSSDIVFFIHSLKHSAASGGVQRNTCRLAAELARRGRRVTILVATTARGDLPESLEGVRLDTLGAPNRWRALMPLAMYLRKHKPTVVIGATQLVNCVLVVARWLSTTTRTTRIVLTERSNLSAEVSAHDNWTYEMLPALMRRCYPHADAIVAVSAGVADDLAWRIGIERTRVRVIYNPIVGKDLFDKAAQSCCHPWFGSEMPIVLGVGRLVPEKGFDVLLRAFAQVTRVLDARLVILGKGRQQAQLEQLAVQLGIDEWVQLLGCVDNPYPYMKQAALLVCSSAHEGFGNVLVEAMACGTPVVSTDCPSGPAEILGHGQWGLLVPLNDVPAMARAIVESLRQSPHADIIWRACQFGVAQAADSYLALIETLRG